MEQKYSEQVDELKEKLNESYRVQVEFEIIKKQVESNNKFKEQISMLE
jgi:hypothetical protein